MPLKKQIHRSVGTFLAGLFFLFLTHPCHAQIYVVNKAKAKNFAYGDTVADYDIGGTKIKAPLISGLSGPEDIIYVPTPKPRLFITNNLSGTVGEYTIYGAPINPKRITGLNGPTGLAYSSALSEIFVVNAGAGMMNVYNSDGTPAATRPFPVPTGSRGVAVSGTNLYVADFTDSLINIYTTSGVFEKSISVPGEGPVGVAVSSGRLFVANYNVGTLSEFQLDGSTVADPLFTGLVTPVGISVLSGSETLLSDNDILFVTEPSIDTIAVYSAAGGSSPLNTLTPEGLAKPYGLVVVPQEPLFTGTLEATSVTPTSEELNVGIFPEGLDTTVYCEYGLSTKYGFNATPQQIPGYSSTAQMASSRAQPAIVVPPGATLVSFLLTGLIPHKTYYYRLHAASSADISVMSLLPGKFVTPDQQIVSADAASYTSAADVELSETVNPNGVATMYYFEYGPTNTYGAQTASRTLTGTKAETVYSLLSGLTPGIMYHYRIVTTSTAGAIYGSDETFTTSSVNVAPAAVTGSAAAGVSEGLFDSLGNPSINNSDHVAFASTLSGNVTPTSDVGIWADDSTGARQLIAQTGMVAPATGGIPFLSFSDPVYNDSEAVAFRAALTVSSGPTAAAAATGIWSTNSGPLALVARQSAAAPGTAGTFADFIALALPDQGGVVFKAALYASSGAQINSSNDEGIWAGNTPADLQLIARTGDMLNGKQIKDINFLPAENYVQGQTRNFAASGNLAYNVTFTDKSSAIVELIGSTLSTVAQTTDVARGTPLATFDSFSNPIINNTNRAAFAATLAINTRTGVDATNKQGIWADDSSGTLQLIARTESGDAPGTTANFAALSDPVYNDNEAVAFRGVLDVSPGQATAATATGIWSSSSGSLTLVARQGGPAPGCPAGATFGGFAALTLPSQAGVVFSASLNHSLDANVTADNDQGIWAVDMNNKLALIVRTGDSLNGKTISSLAFLPASETYVQGQGRSVAEGTGDLAYLATFTDGSTAIIKVIFP